MKSKSNHVYLNRRMKKTVALASLLFAMPIISGAAEIAADDSTGMDLFSYGAISDSGSGALVGAMYSNSYYGAAYYFADPDSSASGTTTVTQTLELTASDSTSGSYFGTSVSLDGDDALVSNGGEDNNAVYYFADLDTAVSDGKTSVTETLKLVSSDYESKDCFGSSVCLSDDNALVGASSATIGSNADQGAVYYYSDISSYTTDSDNYVDGTTATYTETLKLISSDGAASDEFGYSVSLDGDDALVGVYQLESDTESQYVYYYKDMDTYTTDSDNYSSTEDAYTENLKLTASDYENGDDDRFGNSVSLSGDNALVGSYYDDDKGDLSGSAYYYANLDDDISNGDSVVSETLKLIASDGEEESYLGTSVSLSGDDALVGASGAAVGSNSSQGAVYYYGDMDTYTTDSSNYVSGTTASYTETLKITASDGAGGDYFGTSVSIDGDNFTIGAPGANSYVGKAYTGTISSMTTLDEGSASRSINGLSFTSQTNWIVGSTTDSNSVTLSSTDSATVTATGCAVYIGQNSGSDSNTLVINGVLTASTIYVGASGNTGNVLQIGSGALVQVTTLTVASDNYIYLGDGYLAVAGDVTDDTSIEALLSGIMVYDSSSNSWVSASASTVSATYYSSESDAYTATGYEGLDGYTVLTLTSAVPEPATCALFGGLGALGLAFYRRRRARA